MFGKLIRTCFVGVCVVVSVAAITANYEVSCRDFDDDVIAAKAPPWPKLRGESRLSKTGYNLPDAENARARASTRP